MDKGKPSSLFANDGSFMERFKQLQQENEKEKDQGASSGELKRKSNAPGISLSKPVSINIMSSNKPSMTHKTTTPSSGKLAFSLKQKSKLVAPPVKLDEDDEEEVRDTGKALGDVATKRLKLGHPDSSNQSSRRIDVAPVPHPPSDPTVKNVADKLANFVAKHGRNFEHVTRQKNPGDSPFKFLFDESCAEYKYYEYRLHEEEKALSEAKVSITSKSGGSYSNFGADTSQRAGKQPPKYQIPASALYEDNEENSYQTGSRGEATAPSGSDPIAMMEYYMKKAAQEERKRPYKQSHDEMPPPASLQGEGGGGGGPGKRGHHMGDYIPQEELEKFMATCNDVSAQKAAKEAAERAKIQADNVGHKLLSKMGWKEGEGLGSSRKGMSDPIMAGDVKTNNLGVGAHNPGEVLPEDDIYEQYKKRMMLGYRHRPNPLNNPRKAYY